MRHAIGMRGKGAMIMLQDLNEVSDGKVYSINDMVRASCNDCEGCHTCCTGMGDSIILDPYDVWCLQEGTGKNFEELLATVIELGVVEGLILPHLKMTGADERCGFLNEEGRCSIHAFRPGLCRLFPLGRIYEEQGIRYFLQPYACRKTNRSKVKVGKWLNIPQQKKNEEFLLCWHGLKKQLEEKLTRTVDDNTRKTMNLFVLNQFYISLYEDGGDFYEAFEERMRTYKKVNGVPE